MPSSRNNPPTRRSWAGFIAAFGRHQNAGGHPFQLRGYSTGWVGFANYYQRFGIYDGAYLQVGTAGTPYKAHAAGAAASTADGGTIAHGLGVTPDVAICTGSVSSEFVSVTALDSTNITVAIKADDGSAGTTQTIYWQAFDL